MELELEIMKNTEALIAQADQKAQFTLTVGAILLASTTFLTAGKAIDIYLQSATLLMVLALAVSMFFALLVVIPRLPPGSLPKNIFFFGSIVQSSEQVFIEEYAGDAETVMPMLLSEIYVLAVILKRKLGFVRWSFIFLGVSVVLWMVGQVLSLVFAN